MDPKRDRFTAGIAEVTCPECLERYDAQIEDFARDAYDDGSGAGRKVGALEDAVWLVWRKCCQRQGARQLLPKSYVLERQQNDVANLVWQALDARRVGFGGITTKDLTLLFDCIPDELREALRPAIDDLTMAGDLLAEVERMVARAGAHVESIVDEINDGVRAVNYDAIRDHIEESQQRHSKARAETRTQDELDAIARDALTAADEAAEAA